MAGTQTRFDPCASRSAGKDTMRRREGLLWLCREVYTWFGTREAAIALRIQGLIIPPIVKHLVPWLLHLLR